MRDITKAFVYGFWGTIGAGVGLTALTIISLIIVEGHPKGPLF